MALDFLSLPRVFVEGTCDWETTEILGVVADLDAPLRESVELGGEIALVEDRRRMGIYRGSVVAIRRGTVDWPTDVIEFAREAIRDRNTKCGLVEDEPIIEPTVEDAFSERRFELFPPSAVERVAIDTRVDAYDVYRALDELQGILVSELPRLAREYEVEEVGDTYIVISAETNLIDDVLFGYDDDLLSAVASAHVRSSEVSKSIRPSSQPLILGSSKEAIRNVREMLNRSRDASGAETASNSTNACRLLWCWE